MTEPSSQSSKNQGNQRGRRLKTVANATALLRVLSEASRPQGVSELARRLGLGKSSVHVQLQTLSDAGLIELSPDNGRYGLGVGAFELGAAALEHLKLGAYLDPPMERLAALSEEAVSFAIRSRGDAVIVKRFESSQILRAEIRVGTRMPLHVSASGKCMLVELDFGTIDELHPDEKLPEWNPKCITDKRELLEALETVRKNGYALNVDEFTAGVTAVAVNVRDGKGMATGALSIAGPTARFSWEQWLDPLRETAREMSPSTGSQ